MIDGYRNGGTLSADNGRAPAMNGTPPDQPTVLVAHARSVPALERARLADALRGTLPAGTVMVETCHRIEIYADAATAGTVTATIDGGLPDGARWLGGDDAVRHAVQLAVGRDSAIVAEDQILHQVRVAVRDGRAHGSLPPELDRLFDVALRAGRRARSWLPARRPSLADVAIDRALDARRPGTAERRPIHGIEGVVLIIGAGEMARLAAHAAAARGARVVVANRGAERAARLAAEVGGTVAPLDPGRDIASGLSGVIVALSGPWRPALETLDAVRSSGAFVVDLSAPPAVPAELSDSLDRRLITIDDLADGRVDGHAEPTPERLLARLDELVDETVAEFRAWQRREPDRTLARALADRATKARSTELEALWSRVPGLEADERAAIEQMTQRLTERLLRDPLERLHEDDDGERGRAAQELFRL